MPRVHLRRLSLVVLAASCLFENGAAAAKKRKVPDYDGRGGEQKSPGDQFLWVPRVALFPAYVVSEYVIRRPLGALVSGAERAHVPEALYNFFMLSEEHKMGWVPTFFVDFGFKPSAGVYFFWDDAFARGNDLHLQAATWGAHWLAGSVIDRIHLTPRDTLTFRVSGIRRPDYRFYGIGATSVESNLSRYSADKLDASASYDVHWNTQSRIRSAVGVRRLRFGESEDYPRRNLTTRAAQGLTSLPDGFNQGYSAGYSQLNLRFDTRRARPQSQTGARLDLDMEQGSAPATGSPQGWLRYGFIAGGFLDLNDRARVLSLSIAGSFSDPLTSEPVPFTELVQLGGSEPMPGFLPGRLFGRSAFVTTLGYHWPIWVWLDGTLQAAIGNVFDAHLRDFASSRLRFSGALGFETAGISDNPVEMLVGFGTETFEQGANINTLRLVFGTSRGF